MAKKLKSSAARDPAQPPSQLGETGLDLWTAIVSVYQFADRASYEMLFQCCAAADRAEACRRRVAEDGEMIPVASGTLRAHPLIREELNARAFVARVLKYLDLDVAPLQSVPGRPSGR
jgi:hypothetical protein